MASKKKPAPAPAEQKIVQAGKTKPAVKETDTAAETAPAAKGRATGWRIPAIILWVAGIVAIVFGYLGLLDGNTTMFYILLAVAAVCCIAGSLLWKKANRIRPCPVKDDGSAKNKILIFLWNQMGLVAAFITFMPIIFLLVLASKNVPRRVKNIALAIVLVVAVLVGAISIDYDPPVDGVPPEDQVNPATYQIPEGAVIPDAVSLDMNGYWTQFGNSFHLDYFDEDGNQIYCPTIRRSLTIYAGSVADALEAGRLDPCDICAYGDTVKDQQAA